jgi:hypothetical protein
MHPFWRLRDAGVRAAERSRFWQNVTLAVATLVLFVVPQPWPFTFVR